MASMSDITDIQSMAEEIKKKKKQLFSLAYMKEDLWFLFPP